MSILSISFIACFFILLILHWVLPDKYRNIILLLAGWMYIVTWNWIYLVFLAASVIVSYYGGILIYKGKTSGKENRGKMYLTVSIVILLGSLVIVKYTPVMIQVLGISFFTFQAVSYVIDVYRGNVEIEKNFITYALYVSFFPQLAAGPIAKAKEQIARYKQKRVFDLEHTEKALVLALYGCFLKMVIADRIGIFVDDVYANLSSTGRIGIIAAMLLYSVQIYCDFAGYSMIALGLGRCFGIELPVNFMQPYLAKNLGDFWKRWHISLTSWFRDYLYFPLGGNRKGKARTYINILIVFVVSGIWHGAGITFLVWGFLHGIFQVIERCLNTAKRSYRVLTYILVSVLWVFFRSESITQALNFLVRSIVNVNGFAPADITAHGLDVSNIIVLLISLAIMTAVDIARYKDVDLIDRLFGLRLPLRWATLYALIFAVIIFGIYGPGYDAARFIYDKF